MVINALGALKMRVELDRRIEEAIRATRDPAQRDLLQRAQRAPAAPYRTAGDAPGVDVPAEAAPKSEEREQPSGSRVLRLFERRSSLPSGVRPARSSDSPGE